MSPSLLIRPSHDLPRGSLICVDEFGEKKMNHRWSGQSYNRGPGIAAFKIPPSRKPKSLPSTKNPGLNSFVTACGEYIAPEKIENVLATSMYVAQSFVYGDGNRSVLVAVVIPEDFAVFALASRLSIGKASFDELCAHPEIVARIRDDIMAVSKEGNLSGCETVRSIALRSKPFSVENGLLQRQSHRLDRVAAKTALMPDIERMYTRLESNRPSA
ncbi:hypothetical protein LEN26_011039 [Aphanomyces euteiches]|nr:hypothetical protein AeMF1_011350 [Aphanomyces euteiches]KAH9120606.1 hypothetical protein LEN26_011039 [Aphanomyces euteiches]KAH9182736.1 hypothetical protein AeNC1_015289 [Aphanomyces euteiches]